MTRPLSDAADPAAPPVATTAPAWWWLALLAFAVAVLAPGIDTMPVTDRDEGRFAQATVQMLESGDFVDIRFQDAARHNKPIGIYWLQSATVSLFSAIEDRAIWAHRLPSLAGTVAAVMLTAAIGASLAGARVGLLAGVLMASSIILNVEARIAKTDGMLLACILATVWPLVRAYVRARDRAADAPAERPWGWAALFWGAMGAAILIKGPIVFIPVVGIAVGLSLWQRRWRWLLDLRPFPGFVLTILVALPWLVAITVVSDGTFWTESLGEDMFGKVLQGQNTHGAPPGYHTGLFVGVFWPGSILFLLAIPWIVSHRRDDRVRLLLVWIAAVWLVFEIATTKLPHYTLPGLPAVAILTAMAVVHATGWLAGRTAVARSTKWTMMVLWGIGTVALALALPVGKLMLEGTVRPVSLSASVALIALALWTILLLRRDEAQKAVLAMAAGAGLFLAATFSTTVPGFQTVWISPRLAAAMQAVSPCDDPRFGSAGYHEPSFIYLTDTRTQVGADGRVLSALDDTDCAVLAVTEERLDGLRAAAAANGTPLPAPQPEPVRGFNLNGGDPLTIWLYVFDDLAAAGETAAAG